MAAADPDPDHDSDYDSDHNHVLKVTSRPIRVVIIDTENPLMRTGPLSYFAWTNAKRMFEVHVPISKDWPLSWARQGVLLAHECDIDLTKVLSEAFAAKTTLVCIAIGQAARTILQPLCEIYDCMCVTAPSPFWKPTEEERAGKPLFRDVNVFKTTNEIFEMLNEPCIDWSL